MNEIPASEANNRAFIEGAQFIAGDIVFCNCYGEPYYATQQQWENDISPADVGFIENQYPEHCFNGRSEWFEQYEVVDDDNGDYITE